jgi:plastocyanin
LVLSIFPLARRTSLAAVALIITLTMTASAGVERSVSPRQAPPGAIRGRVRFPEIASTVAPRPNVSDLGTSEHSAVDRRTSVVYLDAVPRQAFDELPVGRVRMDQRDEQFVPRLLAITVGTIVDFPNSDTKFHNVFSLSKTHPFDLGRYPPGKTGFERFDRPGLVRVFCDIHSHMSGYILVFSHRYFAVTDVDGRYAIPRVPAGTYTLMVWSELGSAEPRRITVTDGTIAEADFQVGRAQ